MMAVASLRRLLVLLPLVAGSGLADDACLTGAATLGDQRAIVTFRASIDTTCPCATAMSRGAYRRCAKTVLKSSLVAGDLRAACERHGKAIIKGASCGTEHRPCGRVKPSSDVAVSCRRKRDTACTDHAAYDQTSCAAEEFCADVVEWTAGTCSDVRAEGPYGPGVRVLTLTKDSVASPGTPRVLDTLVFYPTTPGAGPIDNFTGGVIDAPIDGSGGPYPILLFSHGSCGYAAQSKFLLPLIASRGFVVVSPPHPGNTIFDGSSCGTPQTQLASFQERPADIVFALDSMLIENANPASDFAGLLDSTRIGMSGHSFGGLTTYLVIQRDARFRAAIPMAPATIAGFQLTVPSLTVIGNVDTVVDNDRTRDAYAASTTPKFLADIQSTGHYAFSDLCPGGPNCAPVVTLTQEEAHDAVLRWVVPFVEWKIRGDERFAAFFATPVPPGVAIESAQ